MPEDTFWTDKRLRHALENYRIIAEVCREGYDTCLAGGDDDEYAMRFLGKLGTPKQKVPRGMQAQTGGRPPAIFGLAECKADVDRALLALPRKYACLLLAFYADGWTLREIARQAHKPEPVIRQWRCRAFGRALRFLGG